MENKERTVDAKTLRIRKKGNSGRKGPRTPQEICESVYTSSKSPFWILKPKDPTAVWEDMDNFPEALRRDLTTYVGLRNIYDASNLIPLISGFPQAVSKKSR